MDDDLTPLTRMDGKAGRRLADQVYERLLEDIVSGALPPGTPMAELDLCERLGVSRTPVREALIKLADVDLVRIYPQSGSVVAPVSREAFGEAQFIREHLECALVAEAVRYMDATSLRELSELIEKQMAAATPEEFYAHDEAFHQTIARTSRHPHVWQVIRQTKIHFDRVRHLTLKEDAGHIPLLIAQHQEILEGLAACNEAQAVAAMRRHLREVFRRADGIFSRQEEVAQAEPRTRARRRR
ncbi:GntR family transcriptional regulator [Bradyrhizobium ontarionense]|uniref:GntR family transcriptional regulator n=1 Tax=Bradyrhizobium ontarionense TaxID=2898149 RepID=A0ABY3RJU8_9BRAD|nr:GntR family transcriptional regulator [Bradyrhizobium sp. A19]UFZ07534.1 GntR family transcriptional regulator [Bradyrhizobium sp. A19]